MVPFQCILAFFDAEALLEHIGENGNIKMMLVTRLMSGQAVYGTDEVRIFAPRRRPHRRLLLVFLIVRPPNLLKNFLEPPFFSRFLCLFTAIFRKFYAILRSSQCSGQLVLLCRKRRFAGFLG